MIRLSTYHLAVEPLLGDFQVRWIKFDANKPATHLKCYQARGS